MWYLIGGAVLLWIVLAVIIGWSLCVAAARADRHLEDIERMRKERGAL